MRLAWVASILSLVALLAACGGGGTTPTAIPTTTLTPVPATTLPASSTVNVSTGQSATFAPINNGYTGTIAFPPVSGDAGSAMTATLQSTLPESIPAPQSTARAPRSIGMTVSPLVYVVLVVSGTASFATSMVFTFTLPRGTSLSPGSSANVGFYDPAQGQWQTLLGPGLVNGQTISFAGITGSVTLTAGTTYAFVLFSTAQPIAAVTPSPSTTTPPTTNPTAQPTAFGNFAIN